MTADPSPLSLTPRQLEVLRFVATYRREYGVSPTISEVAVSFGIAIQTAHGHIQRLIRRGALEGGTERVRGLAVSEAARDHLEGAAGGGPRRSA